MAKHLKSQEGLRILDFGPTSAGNINFITELGHSVYMASLVEDAARPDYRIAASGEDPESFDVTAFLAHNLDFAGRSFDVVLFWDTADYLPLPLVQPVIDRLFDVMDPGGQLLAFFHSKTTGDDTEFTRYHLTNTEQLDLQRIGGHVVLQTFTNRQVEALFTRYAGYKFFLAKDALREVTVTR